VTRLRRIADSYRARLVIGYALVAVVFAAAWGASLYGPLTDAALRQQQRALSAIAHTSATALVTSGADPEQFAAELAADSGLRVTVVAGDGTVLGDSDFDATSMENHATRPEVAEALAGRTGVARRVSATAARDELYVAVPWTRGGSEGAFRVSEPLTDVTAVAARSRGIGLALLAVALAIAIGIATWATRAASQPVAELSEAARRMAAGNLSIQIPEVPEDLDMLASALSTLRAQMRARLEALEAEKRTLQATLDGLLDTVLVLDGERIARANRSANKLFRTPAGGWRDTPLDASGLPGPLEAVVRKHLGDARPFATELDPDPTGRSLRVVVTPFDPSGPSERTIVVISDVTERSRIDRVRRDFVANASHELKTPVAGIRLLAQSVETAAGDGDVDQALAFAVQIEAETDRLQRLVGDLLDLSRLETAPSAEAIADVRVAVDRALVSHRAAAQRKGLELDVDLSAVRGQDVFAGSDPTDLAIALDNLLDNAIAYTERGRVGVAATATPDTVAITVSDTGPGIAPEHQARVFERFYRVDRGRSRDSGGTGLGLALVRHVVERAGGAVMLSSTLGEGATFTLTLPRAR